MSRIGLLSRLVRRFARSAALWRAAGIPFVVVTGLMAMYVLLEAFSLTSDQVAERDLGRFDTRTELAAAQLTPGRAGIGDAAERAAREAGAHQSAIVLESLDVTLTGERSPLVAYREASWSDNLFPDRYSLAGGRWPVAAGEAVITSELAPRVSGGALSAFAGNLELRIVGQVRDRYATDGAIVLAGPGTWQSLDGDVLAAKHPETWAMPVLYSAGAEAGALDRELRRVPALGETVVRTHGELANQRSWVERVPLAFKVPSIVLPLLCVVAVFTLAGRWRRRRTLALRSLGVSSRAATLALCLACALSCLAGALGGIAIGALLGAALRPLAQLAATRPLSPYADVVGPAARIVVVAGIGCFGATVAALSRDGWAPLRALASPAPRPSAPGTLRHVAATAAGAVAVWQLVGLSDLSEAVLLTASLTAVAALTAPEIVAFVLPRLRWRGARGRLARSQMQADTGRVAAVAALVAATLGPASASVVLMETSAATDEAARLSLAAPGQILMVGANPLEGPPERLAGAVVRAAGSGRQPIRVETVETEDRRAVLSGVDGSILAVHDVRAAETLNNGPLEPDQRRALLAGGAMLWREGARDRATVSVIAGLDESGEEPRGTMPLASGRFQANWSQWGAALTLIPTAKRLGLPLSHTAVVLAPVGAADARRAEEVAQELGYSSRFVMTNTPTSPAELPLAYWAAAIGLCSLLLLTLLALTRAQAAALRGYLSGLVALGISPRWAGSVLRIELAVSTGIGAVLGLAAGALPIVATKLKAPELVLAAPVAELLAIAGLFLGALWLATAVSTLRLRAAERA